MLCTWHDDTMVHGLVVHVCLPEGQRTRACLRASACVCAGDFLSLQIGANVIEGETAQRDALVALEDELEQAPCVCRMAEQPCTRVWVSWCAHQGGDGAHGGPTPVIVR